MWRGKLALQPPPGISVNLQEKERGDGATSEEDIAHQGTQAEAKATSRL